MAFNPDTDANYQAFLKTRGSLTGPQAEALLDQLAQFFGQKSTAGSTLNTALFTTGLTAAVQAVKSGVPVASGDANYLALSSPSGSFSDGDAFEYLEHIVKAHAQLATASTVLSAGTATTAVSNAKNATKAKKYTY